MSPEEMRKILDEPIENQERGVDTRKFSGIIHWNIDPIRHQRKIRKDDVHLADGKEECD